MYSAVELLSSALRLVFLTRTWVFAARQFRVLGQHEEDMLLLLALVGSQSANLVFWVIAQRNLDNEFFEYGLERSLTANGAIAAK